MRLADDPCDAVTGPAHESCQTGGGTGGAGNGAENGSNIGDSLDPLTSLAKSCAKAAAWTARKVGDFVGEPSAFDVTDDGFIKQYSVVFAATTVLVLLLWLLAVAKRAVRGVPLTTAIGEAIGLLWLAVLTTAFMPLVLYTVVAATSAVSRTLASAIGQEPGTVFDKLASGLTSGDVGGGPLMLVLLSLLVILLCGAVGLLLVLRSLGLYVGALLGIPIFAGLVDRDMWVHTRKWSGVMAGLIAIEPVLIIVIGLAAAVQAEGDVVTGIAITAIACAVTITLITKTPGWGDSVRFARMTARGLGSAVNTVVGGGGTAAGGVRAGISTHSVRDRTPPRSTGGSSEKSAGGISGGMSAHSQRPHRPAPKKDEK
jgi:hypothetical protein